MRENVEVTKPFDTVILLLLDDKLGKEATWVVYQMSNAGRMLDNGVTLCLLHVGLELDYLQKVR